MTVLASARVVRRRRCTNWFSCCSRRPLWWGCHSNWPCGSSRRLRRVLPRGHATGILHFAIGVWDQSRSRATLARDHGHCGRRQGAVERWSHRLADKTERAAVQDSTHIQAALAVGTKVRSLTQTASGRFGGGRSARRFGPIDSLRLLSAVRIQKRVFCRPSKAAWRIAAPPDDARAG
jgi:hypothetical protein